MWWAVTDTQSMSFQILWLQLDSDANYCQSMFFQNFQILTLTDISTLKYTLYLYLVILFAWCISSHCGGTLEAPLQYFFVLEFCPSTLNPSLMLMWTLSFKFLCLHIIKKCIFTQMLRLRFHLFIMHLFIVYLFTSVRTCVLTVSGFLRVFLLFFLCRSGYTAKLNCPFGINKVV